MEGNMVMVTEVASLMEGEWSCYRGGQFNSRENGHVTEVESLMERRMVMLEVASLMEGEWSCYGGGGGQFNGGRMVMLQRWPV